jgi:hypothetical protein
VHAQRRMQKPMAQQGQFGDRGVASAGSPKGTPYLGVLEAEPETRWPPRAEQRIQAEDDAARYLQGFARQCADTLGFQVHLFGRSARTPPTSGSFWARRMQNRASVRGARFPS